MIDFGLSTEAFRSEWFEKKLRLQKGAAPDARIQWRDLDELLERIEPRDALLKLVGRGPIPVDAYSEETLEMGLRRRRLNKIRFYSYIRSGAALVIDRAEIHSALARRLCDVVGRFACMRTSSNAYLSCGGDGAFGKHWDTHDVFAVQLMGRKRWQVFAPTFPLPLSHQVSAPADSEADTELILDVLLEPGDLLYIPRGWPHRTRPLPEGSFHVSVGLYGATVHDFFLWACAQCLPQQAAARRSFDAGAVDSGDMLGLLERLRTFVLDQRRQSEFESEMIGRRQARSEFDFAQFVDPACRPPDENRRVRLTTCKTPQVVRGEMTVNGARVTLDPTSETIVAALREGPLRLHQLQAAAGDVTIQTIQRAVLNLAGHEIVTIEK